MFFSTQHPKPNEDRNEQTYTNKRDIVFGSERVGRKLPKSSTHYLTLECNTKSLVYISFQQDLQSSVTNKPRKLQSLPTQFFREHEIFQKEPGESVAKMVQRVTNSNDFDLRDEQLKAY